MFIDDAKIKVKAGNGGDGAVSFHREKFVAAGGPDGGDGGKGGNIVFVGDPNLSTLMDFKYKRKYEAPNGENGRACNSFGKSGQDLIIRVPIGTLVKDADSDGLIADISSTEPVVIAKGGKGGLGNSHFKSSTRQIPRFAKPGFPGEAFFLKLELKLIADVGLIGFPNVGKSTTISCISAAKPKIANYHFTTLSPVLGVVRVAEEASFVAADIPGLIEGAAEGIGLGHDFLRHVERCRLLLHVVDVSGCEGRDPIEDFKKINNELENFSPELATRPQIVLANKCDIATEEQREQFAAFIKEQGLELLEVSAATGRGLDKLPGIVWEHLKELPPVVIYTPNYVRPEPELGRRYEVVKEEDGSFTVTADWLERILQGSDVDDYESLQYFQTQLADSGILEELVKLGVQENDTVRIGDYEFDYLF